MERRRAPPARDRRHLHAVSKGKIARPRPRRSQSAPRKAPPLRSHHAPAPPRSRRRTMKPTLGISMGDPAGIGPEIIVKALAAPHVHDLCRPLVIADAQVIRRAAKLVSSRLAVRAATSPKDARFDPNTINVYDLHNVDINNLKLGTVSAMAGNAAFQAVKTMIDLAMAKQIDATVTAP